MAAKANGENIQISNEEILNHDEMVPSTTNLLCMPNEILLNIFAALNDTELLHVACTCTRFEPIAKLVFEQRYTTEYFVIQRKYKQSTCEALIEQFHNIIKAIEIHEVSEIDNRHWLMNSLSKCPIERIKFVDCNFENVKNALSNHKQITHLSFHGGCGYSFVKLPYLHNLKEFKVHHFDGMYYADYMQVIRNNRQLNVIEIVDDSVNEPCEMFELVQQYHQNLKELCVINEAKPLKLLSTNALNSFENVSKCIESLDISTDNTSTEYLRRLSLGCKKITRLKLFHVDHTLSNEMVDIVGLFDQIESLSLVLKTYEEGVVSIADKLTNLNHLSLTYRRRTPTSNDYILTFLRRCEKLTNIAVDTHIDRFKLKQPEITEKFRNDFIVITKNRHSLVIFKLKEEGKIIATIRSIDH